MFHQKSDKVTVVVYDEAKKAVTFTLKRGILKRTVMSVVLMIALLLTTIGYLVLNRRQKVYSEFEKFQKEQNYIKDKEDLLAKIQLLTDENNNLLMKLNASDVATNTDPTPTITPEATLIAQVTPTPSTVATLVPPTPTTVANQVLTPKATVQSTSTSLGNVSADIFNYVKRPIGFKDITNQNLVKVDNVQLSQNLRGVTLNFDLINNANETKITGYALVVQRNNSGQIGFYPAHPAYINVTKVPYNIGEQFGFSRMRPVVASFRNKYVGSNSFTILIFTRAGDLLLKKEIGPYEIK
ncbi:MAG: hypothetical protein ACOYL6_10610 [Bacteriovoracaceae bacterium]